VITYYEMTIIHGSYTYLFLPSEAHRPIYTLIHCHDLTKQLSAVRVITSCAQKLWFKTVFPNFNWQRNPVALKNICGTANKMLTYESKKINLKYVVILTINKC